MIKKTDTTTPNIKDKVYSMFILGTDGDGYKQALSYQLGGLIFFSHDIKNKTQCSNFIKEIKENSKYPLFLSKKYL